MSALTDLTESLYKAIGENDEAQQVTQFIDTGYAPLNKAISGRYGGGLPFGRLVEMFGESSTGKTALATKWMIEAQRMGGVGMFIDWERSFNVEMAKDLGLNTDAPFWLYKRPVTWEAGNMFASKACQIIRKSKAISDDAPILVVFDSIASARPQSTIDKEIDELSMNDSTALARVASQTLKTQAHWAGEFNATFLYLNQVRLKPGVVYGDPRTTPGGKAMEFYASARLALGRKKLTETVDGEKEFVGQVIDVEVVKSKFTKPFQHAEMRMMFDEHGIARFDITTSLIDYAVANGKLQSSGPRVTWTDGKSYFKSQLAKKIDEEGITDQLSALLNT